MGWEAKPRAKNQLKIIKMCFVAFFLKINLEILSSARQQEVTTYRKRKVVISSGEITFFGSNTFLQLSLSFICRLPFSSASLSINPTNIIVHLL